MEIIMSVQTPKIVRTVSVESHLLRETMMCQGSPDWFFVAAGVG
jgi:hypothetical protein